MLNGYIACIFAGLVMGYGVTCTIYLFPLVTWSYGMVQGVGAYVVLMSPIFAVWYQVQKTREKRHLAMLLKPECPFVMLEDIEAVRRRVEGQLSA